VEKTLALLRATGRIAVYPASMAAAVWTVIAAMDAGVESGLAVVAVNVAAALVVLVFERVLPYRRAWNASAGDVRTDVLHAAFNGVTGEIGRLLTVAGLTFVSVRLSTALGTGLWPSRWPLWAQLALAFPIGELPVYWIHRLEHRGGFLWRLHAVHHSAPRLYFLNATRNHPIDAVVSLAFLVAPLVLLGAGERLLAVAMVVWAVHALFQHGNVDVRLGPLNWLLSMAEVHRWHHSRRIDEANANYGQTLLVWDIVFGTRRVPEGREPPEDVGLAGLPAYPAGWLGQLASPFDRALWQATSGNPSREESAAPDTSQLPPTGGPGTPET
jgi:sterol desaturase/sphingolipid hydroxylase (fatty acid hydroxylase superfamily)